MAERLPNSVYRAINRAMTPAFNRWSRKTYGMSGKRLLAKVAAVEGGGSIDEGTSATSYAGARGPFQFIASTRQGYIRQYKVDPWKNDTSAARAAMIHLRNTGVRGYNPGLGSYEGMVLGAKVDTRPLRTGRVGGERGGLAGGRGGASGGLRPGRGAVQVSPASLSRSAGQEGSGGIDVVGLLAESLKQRPQIQSQGVQAPQFSASPAFPSGYQPIDSSGAAVVDDSLDDALQALATLRGSVPGRSVVSPGQVRSIVGPARARAGTGRSAFSQDALFDVQRDGWKGAKSVGIGLVRASKLPVSSEKRSTVKTASGNVSDHYQGNRDSFAWDLSVSGPKGTKIARKLARMLGAKWSGGSWLSVNKKIEGRTYRFQIGWNVPDHYDHIHLGIDRLDTPG